MYKSKSECIPSDVDNQFIQKLDQIFFVGGHRLEGNMSLEFFNVATLLEWFQSFFKGFIKRLVNPK
jgi:hypothetical protein